MIGRALFATSMVLVCCASTLTADEAHAAGFAVADQGAGASGVGNAATARFDLPEAAFFNPAATVFSDNGVAIGTALVLPEITHTSPSTGVSTAAQTSATPVPHLHANYQFPFGFFLSGYAGVPFGSSIEWDDEWIGRFEVTQLSLRVFETGLNVGYVMGSDGVLVGVAAGPRFLMSDVELRRRVDAVDTEGDVRIVGDARAISGQASLAAFLWGVQVGVNYRPRVTLDYTGEANFSDIPIELANRARDQDVTTSVTLPDRIAIGLGAELLDLVKLSLDVEVFLWSTFEEFGIDFASEDSPDVSQPRDWENTVAVRLGAEWDPDLFGLLLRSGLAWDPTPGPNDTLSPTSPDSSRLVLTVGAGWQSDFGLTVSAAWGHFFLQDQESTGEAFPGEYSGNANVFNLGASYSF